MGEMTAEARESEKWNLTRLTTTREGLKHLKARVRGNCNERKDTYTFSSDAKLITRSKMMDDDTMAMKMAG